MDPQPHSRRLLLEGQFQHPEKQVRLSSISSVQEADRDAIEPLLQALQDPEMDVRIAAAEALGRVGDARAIQPLVAALRATFGGKSGREFRTAGILLIVGVVVVYIAVQMGLGAAGIGSAGAAMSGGISFIFNAMVLRRKAQSRMSRAITEALGRIAERDPAPELHALVPDLRAIAADSLQQEKEARAASREAASRIEAVTAKLKDLPLPTSGSASGPEALPRPAGPPAEDGSRFPVVGDS